MTGTRARSAEDEDLYQPGGAAERAIDTDRTGTAKRRQAADGRNQLGVRITTLTPDRVRPGPSPGRVVLLFAPVGGACDRRPAD